MSVRQPTSRYLAPIEAKRFHDRLGSGQDWQRFLRKSCHQRTDRACCFSTRRTRYSGSDVERGRSPLAYCKDICPQAHAMWGSTSAPQWSHWRSNASPISAAVLPTRSDPIAEGTLLPLTAENSISFAMAAFMSRRPWMTAIQHRNAIAEDDQRRPIGSLRALHCQFFT